RRLLHQTKPERPCQTVTVFWKEFFQGYNGAVLQVFTEVDGAVLWNLKLLAPGRTVFISPRCADSEGIWNVAVVRLWTAELLRKLEGAKGVISLVLQLNRYVRVVLGDSDFIAWNKLWVAPGYLVVVS